MGADAAGNMTYRETVAGGNRLTYKHDRWGRLTEVWFSNGAPSGTPNRAVYRYNGLSMRCLIERDSNAADLSNTLNERRALYYGAGWQVLEERVDADKDADYDRLAQNVWGLRHIDDLVLRRANANWNAGADTDFSDAGDTDWEQFLNDHQFSVVAGVNRSGTLTFRLAYDAYGEARHSWAKDVDGDGAVGAADWTIARDAQGKQIHQTGYVADADWNRDGTVTSTDVAAFGSTYYTLALAGGLLASTSSDLNVGYCGYRFDAELGAYTVRFRHYDPTPGVARWLERDPAGYADGPSLYGYLGRSPVEGADPLGLVGIDDGSVASWTRGRSTDMGSFPPGTGKIVAGTAAVVGGVLAAPFAVGPLAALAVLTGLMYGADSLSTGLEEFATGSERDTRTHEMLVEIAGEQAAARIEAAIAVLDVGYGVWELGLTGWKFLRHAPGHRPGFVIARYYPDFDGAVDGQWWLGIKLSKGTTLSRYGSRGGRFAADVGTKFEHRSLPGSLSEWDEIHIELLEDMEVDISFTAPWFDQPGGALQYRFHGRVWDLAEEGKLRIKEMGPCWR